MASEPQSTLLPEAAVLVDDVLLLAAAVVPVTNCEEPQTIAFAQAGVVFHTAEGSSVK